jgi:hypothetical protein
MRDGNNFPKNSITFHRAHEKSDGPGKGIDVTGVVVVLVAISGYMAFVHILLGCCGSTCVSTAIVERLRRFSCLG